MNRDEALTQLGNGEKVRYSLWDKKDYICINNGHLITNTGENAAIACIINNDTDDWEFFEENKDLSSKIFTTTIVDDKVNEEQVKVIRVEDIKEFIKELKVKLFEEWNKLDNSAISDDELINKLIGKKLLK